MIRPRMDIRRRVSKSGLALCPRTQGPSLSLLPYKDLWFADEVGLRQDSTPRIKG